MKKGYNSCAGGAVLMVAAKTSPLRELVKLAKLCWRIEHDCQRLKAGVGASTISSAVPGAFSIMPRCISRITAFWLRTSVSFYGETHGYRVRPVALFVELFREAQPRHHQAIRQTYKY
jgi:hypothetical protein